MIFMPICKLPLNSYLNTKIKFGMVPVAIWYEYHTSVFCSVKLQLTKFHVVMQV